MSEDCWCLFAKGDYERALSLLEGRIGMDDDAYVRLARSQMNLYLGKYSRVLEDLNLIELQLPDHAFHQRGAAYWMMGERERACETWARIIDERRNKRIVYGRWTCSVDSPALLYWAAAHPGCDHWLTRARAELKRSLKTKACQLLPWPRALGAFLLGEADENELLASTEFEVRIQEAQRRSQSCLYRAVPSLLNGDWHGAIERYAEGVAVGFFPKEVEFLLARQEILQGKYPLST
jgi:hypothetical protein